MRLYLDLCCFNRPFDEQTQLVVRLQTEAKLWVQEGIRSGRFTLIWSPMLDLENNANPDPDRRKAIAGWREVAQLDVPTEATVEAVAEAFVERGLKSIDALHVASAVEGGASCFLTTDRAIVRKMREEKRLRVLDPVDFVRQLEEEDDEV